MRLLSLKPAAGVFPWVESLSHSSTRQNPHENSQEKKPRSQDCGKDSTKICREAKETSFACHQVVA
jgi:hypothetical protein